jgi:PIN domain
MISPAGAPREIVTAWTQGHFDLVASPLLLDELRDVLARPRFRRWVSAATVAEYLDGLTDAALIIDDPPVVPGLSPDPDDDYLIALARIADADYARVPRPLDRAAADPRPRLTLQGHRWTGTCPSPTQAVRSEHGRCPPRRARVVIRRASRPRGAALTNGGMRYSPPSERCRLQTDDYRAFVESPCGLMRVAALGAHPGSAAVVVIASGAALPGRVRRVTLPAAAPERSRAQRQLLGRAGPDGQ